MYKRFIVLVAGLFFIYSNLFANQGGSDTFGHKWTDSKGSAPIVTYNWVDARDGTAVFAGAKDDATAGPFGIGFSFSYYGSTYTNIYVSSNGLISFGSLADSKPVNGTIPTGAENFIAGYWDDLAGTTAGNVYYKTTGTAPFRKFVVQWEGFEHKTVPGGGQISFEIVLFENSNLVKLQYSSTSDPNLNGSSATIGLNSGTDGIQYAKDTAGSVAGGQAILFHPASAATSGNASISPASVAAGTNLQQFVYTLNSLGGGVSGLGEIDHLVIANPFTTNTPSVTDVKIDGNLVPVQNSASAPTDAGFASWSYAGNSIVVQTAPFEVKSSLEVTFVQNTDNSPGSGNYSSTFEANLLSGSSQSAANAGWAVTVNATTPHHFTKVAGGEDPLTAGGNRNLQVTLYDELNNTISGSTVTFTRTSGGNGNFGGSSNTTTVTDASGIATAAYTASTSTADGPDVVEVTIGSVNTTFTIPLQSGAASSLQRLLPRTSSDTTASSGTTLELKAKLVDSNGNGISGSNVTFQRTSGGNGVFTTTGTSSIIKTTASDGTASALFQASSNVSDSPDLIQVSSTGVSSLNITVNLQASTTIAYYTVTDPTAAYSYGAGTQFDVEVNAYDSFNNLVTGSTQSVTLSDDGSSVTYVNGTTKSLSGGKATFTVKSNVKQTGVHFTVTDGSLNATSSPFTITAGGLNELRIYSGPNGTGTRYSGQAIGVTADETIAFYAAGYDAFGNFIADIDDAKWSTTGQLAPAISNQTGAYLVFDPTTSGVSGTMTVAKTGVTGDATGQITVSDGAPASAKILLDSQGNTELGNRTMTSNTTLTVYSGEFDGDGNFISLASANWTANPTALGTFSSSPSTSTTFTAKEAGSGTIQITTVGNGLSDVSGAITVQAGNPGVIAVQSGDNQTGPAGQALPLPLQVLVTDVNSNPVSGTTVTWNAVGGGDLGPARATETTSLTNTSGIAAISWTLKNTTGPDSVIAHLATFTTTPETLTFRATSEPQENRVMTATSATTFSGAILSNSWPIQVKIEDALNNPVSGASVSFAILEKPTGAANEALSVTQTTTNASGVAQSFFTFGTKLGDYTIVVSSNAQPNQLTFTGTANVPAAPNAIQVVAGNNQTGTAGQPVADLVKVKLVDQYENAISGQNIQFLTLGEGDAVNPASIATDANGLAETQWTLGQTVQNYHLLAQLASPLVVSDTIFATANPTGTINVAVTEIRGVPQNNVSALAGSAVPFKVKVTDQFNNPVENVTVNFSVINGPQAQLGNTSVLTNSTGEAVNSVLLDNSVDLTTIRATTVSRAVVDVNIYRLRYNSLTPTAAPLGQTVAFAVQVVNPGPNPVALATGASNSFIRFTDGNREYKAGLATATIAGNAATTLNFANTTLNTQFTIGSYTPEIKLKGSGADSQLNGNMFTGPNELKVFSVELLSANVTSPTNKMVALGASFDVELVVRNNGSLDVNIDDALTTPILKLGGTTVSENFTKLSSATSVPAGSQNFPIQYRFSETALLQVNQTYTIDGRFGGTISGGGQPVPTVTAGATDAVTIIETANVVYEGGLAPASVTNGDTVKSLFSVLLSNSGQRDIVLDPSQTTFAFGTDVFNLASGQIIPGGGTPIAIYFSSGTIQSAVNTSGYTVTLNLSGAEEGVPYSKTFTADKVKVYSKPTAVAVQNFDVGSSSAGQGEGNITLQFDVFNPSNSAAIQISDSSSVTLHSQGSFTIESLVKPTAFPVVVSPGGIIPFEYKIKFPEDYPTGVDNLWASLKYVDNNSNKNYQLNASNVTDQIQILKRATLNVVSITASEDTVSQGQTNVGVQMSVKNNGQVAAQLTSADINFVNPHPVTVLTTPLPTIQPGATASISFKVDILSNANVGSDPISGTLNYRDTRNNTLYEEISGNLASIFIQLYNSDLVSIQSVDVPASVANLGQNNIPAKVNVHNGGQSVIEINQVQLFFNPGGLTQTLTTAIPVTIAGQKSKDFNFQIAVPQDASTGSYRVDAQIAYKDLNSNDTNNKIGAVQIDSIAVQSPSNLVLSPVLIEGSQSATVSTGKKNLTLQFYVTNSGQAPVKIDSVSRAAIPAHLITTRKLPQGLPTLAGNDTAFFTYNLDVGDQTGNFSLNFKAFGTDFNTQGQIESNLSASPANVIVRNPGEIAIDSVVVSADTVLKGQDSVRTTVYLKNPGEMPVQVKNVSLNFNKTGFAQQLLDALDFTVAAQETKSVALLLKVLNSAPLGKAAIGANVTAIEQSLLSELAAQSPEKDTVLVMNQALVRVDTMQIVNLSNFPRANQGQQLNVRAAIKNLSGVTLEEVQVSLLQNDTLIFSKTGLTIQPGNTLETFFTATAPSRSGTTIYKVRIDSAFSFPGRQAARIEQPRDNSELIVVEKAASMSLTLNPGTRSFLPGKSFTFFAEALNSGEAKVEGGKIELILPQKFSLTSGENSIIEIDGTGLVSWKIEADNSTLTGWENLVAKFKEIPTDVNLGSAAAAVNLADTSQIRIDTTSVVESTSEISDPSGAVDGTVSASQYFTIRQDVIFSGGIADEGRVSEIILPDGYSLEGSSQIEWGSESRHLWRVRASEATSDNDILQIRTTGIESERAIVDTVDNFISVKVISAPLLGVRLKMVGVADTLTGYRLSFNQNFKIRASVFNLGAAGIEGVGKLKLMLAPQDSIIILAGDTSQVFTDNDTLTAEWLLKAPGRTVSSNIRVGFDQLPLDENSSEPAKVDAQSGIASLSISTTNRTMRVRRIAEVHPVSSPRQGSQNVPLLGLEFFNEKTSQSVKTVSLDSLFLEFNGLNERTLDLVVHKIKVVEFDTSFTKTPESSRTLAEYNVASESSNLVQIKFSDILDIEPGIKKNIKILVDITNDAPNINFSMLVQDIFAYELQRSNRVELVDSTGRAFEPKKIYESPATTVISSNEKEIFSNYPNPFPQAGSDNFTRFVFLAKGSGSAEIFVYTLMGGLVWSNKMDFTGSGDHLMDGAITWDGVNNSGNRVLNGVYLAIIKIKDNGGGRTFKTKIAYIK